MAKRKPTKADLEARRRLRDNAERTRLLAEQALAKLPASVRAERERAGSNAAWLQLLAERAQAERDAHERAGP